MNKYMIYIVTLLSWLPLIICFAKDRSRYRNCYYLFFALVVSVICLSMRHPYVLLALAVFILLSLLIVPVFLIINGIQMIQREGKSLANLLSLGFGIMIGTGELATLYAIVSPAVKLEIGTQIFDISVISICLGWTVIYVSLSFLVFMIYCLFLQIIPRKRDFDYVIIHGAGLLGGERVTKLLSERLDKAIEIYRKDPTPPMMIPSGGRGDDEKVSEAEAMENYLLEKGIPAERIIREDRSRTTYENLMNSKEILDSLPGRKYTVLVTSNYHVYRALRYCSKIGLDCTGVGSHVAFYYWPSALIREFIAVHAEKKHMIIFIVGWLLWLLPLIIGIYAF